MKSTSDSTDRSRLRMTLQGQVQGVGFRPHVYRLAQTRGLSGWITNTTEGVVLEIEGHSDRLARFARDLLDESRAPVSISRVRQEWVAPRNEVDFRILDSRQEGEIAARLLPDLGTCQECLVEIFDSGNRRHRYPFTNCTRCGPRFTIVEALPYDRGRTSMRDFIQCSDCLREYESPSNRRFHAEPNACAACGPHLELWGTGGERLCQHEAALAGTVSALRAGEIVACKGIGGFHLMTDAGNEKAVRKLRERKAREEKPFAVLFPSLAHLKRCCFVSDEEAQLLLSPAAPIVILRRRDPALGIASAVAPDTPNLGVMLPSNPLHYLLMHDFGRPLVATSGNLSEEPLCLDERDAVTKLNGIADKFLVHNRRILRQADDSVVRVVAARPLILRSGRGYAPRILEFATPLGDHLAVGGHLKNAVALSSGNRILLSQHIGDLSTWGAAQAFESTLSDLARFYRHAPVRIAADPHPEYHSSRWAARTGKTVLNVQHHVAHILAILVDNHAPPPALGVAWDGTGLGTDGRWWGGEFFEVTDTGVRHFAQLRSFPLPGGERAIREGWRVALGLLHELWGETVWESPLPQALGLSAASGKAFSKMLASPALSPRATSVGRLFDGVAALLGVRRQSSYEGQAAMSLEYLAEGSAEAAPYSFGIRGEKRLTFDWGPLLTELVSDLNEGISKSDIARRFHLTLTGMILAAAKSAGLENVALGGGCFQNKLLLELTIERLRKEGFTPLWSREIPPNDGGLAVGQLAKAAWETNGRFVCV